MSGRFSRAAKTPPDPVLRAHDMSDSMPMPAYASLGLNHTVGTPVRDASRAGTLPLRALPQSAPAQAAAGAAAVDETWAREQYERQLEVDLAAMRDRGFRSSSSAYHQGPGAGRTPAAWEQKAALGYDELESTFSSPRRHARDYYIDARSSSSGRATHADWAPRSPSPGVAPPHSRPRTEGKHDAGTPVRRAASSGPAMRAADGHDTSYTYQPVPSQPRSGAVGTPLQARLREEERVSSRQPPQGRWPVSFSPSTVPAAAPGQTRRGPSRAAPVAVAGWANHPSEASAGLAAANSAMSPILSPNGSLADVSESDAAFLQATRELTATSRRTGSLIDVPREDSGLVAASVHVSNSSTPAKLARPPPPSLPTRTAPPSSLLDEQHRRISELQREKEFIEEESRLLVTLQAERIAQLQRSLRVTAAETRHEAAQRRELQPPSQQQQQSPSLQQSQQPFQQQPPPSPPPPTPPPTSQQPVPEPQPQPQPQPQQPLPELHHQQSAPAAGKSTANSAASASAATIPPTVVGNVASVLSEKEAAIAELREILSQQTQEVVQLRGAQTASNLLVTQMNDLAEARHLELQDKHSKERKKQKQAFERLSSALEESTKGRHKWKKRFQEEKAERDKLALELQAAMAQLTTAATTATSAAALVSELQAEKQVQVDLRAEIKQLGFALDEKSRQEDAATSALTRQTEVLEQASAANAIAQTRVSELTAQMETGKIVLMAAQAEVAARASEYAAKFAEQKAQTEAAEEQARTAQSKLTTLEVEMREEISFRTNEMVALQAELQLAVHNNSDLREQLEVEQAEAVSVGCAGGFVVVVMSCCIMCGMLLSTSMCLPCRYARSCTSCVQLRQKPTSP